VPPGIALVVAMVLALLDAAAPKDHRPGRLDVSILIAIAVVLVGVGVGGFALTAGTEYVGGYLTGNESGEDRLVKPVAKTSGAITVTVENVTYTSHFTRVEVMLANGAKEPITIPIEGAAFTAADGTALHADTHRSNWPSKVATGGTSHRSSPPGPSARNVTIRLTTSPSTTIPAPAINSRGSRTVPTASPSPVPALVRRSAVVPRSAFVRRTALARRSAPVRRSAPGNRRSVGTRLGSGQLSD
jgi:hypothetical protein